MQREISPDDRRTVEQLMRLIEESKTRAVPSPNSMIVPRLKYPSTVDELDFTANRMGEGHEVSEVLDYNGRPTIVQGTVTARFKERPDEAAIRALSEAAGVEKVEQYEYDPHSIRFRPTRVNPMRAFAVASAIGARPEIEWAEPDLLSQVAPSDDMKQGAAAAADPVNDLFYTKQWYLLSGPAGINVPEAWSRSLGSDKLIVAVIDNGVDLDHKELAAKYVPGYDFVDQDDSARPAATDPHGTACAGLIAAATNNGIGIASVSRSPKIMPLRVYGPTGFVNPDHMARALLHAQKHGARIVSVNWGCTPSNKITRALRQVTDPARPDECCLVITAAGNARPPDDADDPPQDVGFPARAAPCIAVGAVDRKNLRWYYSCFGPNDELDLVGPSGDVDSRGDIWTLDITGAAGWNPGGSADDEASGDYTSRFGGTSAAAPIVAGVAALVWSTYPELTAQEIRKVLEDTATKVDPTNGGWTNDRSKTYGFGKVDARAALEAAQKLAQAKKADPAAKNGPQAPPTAPVAPAPVQNPSARAPAQPTERQRPTRDREQEAARQMQQQRIDAILQPTRTRYKVDGKEIAVTPNSKWVSIALEKNPFDERTSEAEKVNLRKTLASVLSRAAAESLASPSPAKWPLGPAVAGTEGHHVFLLPRDQLNDRNTLVDLAVRGLLPCLTPVYNYQGSLVIPTPTLSCAVSSVKEKNFQQLIKSFGLEVIGQEDDEYRLRLTHQTPFPDVFAAAQRIGDSNLVKWVEPDLISQVRH